MTSLPSAARLFGASVGLVLAALAASAASTGIGSAMAFDVEPHGAYTFDDDDDESDDDESDDDESEIEPDEDDDAPAAQAPQRRRARARARSIVQGNPFCPPCRALAREQANPRRSLPTGPTPSQLPLELVATMITKPADESIAIIAHAQTQRSAPFRPSDYVRENVFVERITRTRVLLNHDGQLEFLDLNGRYCTRETPCQEGMGNCESDAQCQPGLVCGEDLGALYRLPTNYAICVPPECTKRKHKPMSTRFCSETCRCTSGMGDCDDHEDCLPGHVCVDDNGPQFKKPRNWDVCVHEHCTNGRRDADETGVDCGGSRCGMCL